MDVCTYTLSEIGRKIVLVKLGEMGLRSRCDRVGGRSCSMKTECQVTSTRAAKRELQIARIVPNDEQTRHDRKQRRFRAASGDRLSFLALAIGFDGTARSANPANATVNLTNSRLIQCCKTLECSKLQGWILNARVRT